MIGCSKRECSTYRHAYLGPQAVELVPTACRIPRKAEYTATSPSQRGMRQARHSMIDPQIEGQRSYKSHAATLGHSFPTSGTCLRVLLLPRGWNWSHLPLTAFDMVRGTASGRFLEEQAEPSPEAVSYLMGF